MSGGGGGGGGSSLVPSGGSQLAAAAGTPSQVQISYTPFSFGKLKRNKRKGTATLSVNVPGPGTLVLAGKGLVKKRPGERARRAIAKAVSATGTVKRLRGFDWIAINAGERGLGKRRPLHVRGRPSPATLCSRHELRLLPSGSCIARD